MKWTHIDSANLNGTPLDLYEREGLHMVRVDGYELMNGNWHESEDALGRLAVQLARIPRPHVLIGGLGLGYTLASASRTMRNDGRITVGEISAAIIDWFHRFVSGRVQPANVTIEHNDITKILRSGRTFDVIALDVDNGPEALVQEGNAFLYTEAGLSACRTSLSPGGVLLVWSSFESPDFAILAEAAGFHVTCAPMNFRERPEVRHYIYALSPTPFTQDELDLLADGNDFWQSNVSI
jgi:spermidine synthase